MGHFCRGSNKFLVLYNTQPRIMTMQTLRQQLSLHRQLGLRVPLDPQRSIAPFRFSKLPDSDERLYLWQQMLVPRSPLKRERAATAVPTLDKYGQGGSAFSSQSAQGRSDEAHTGTLGHDGSSSVQESVRTETTPEIPPIPEAGSYTKASKRKRFSYQQPSEFRRRRSATVDSRSTRAHSAASSDSHSLGSVRKMRASTSFDDGTDDALSSYIRDEEEEDDESLRRNLSRASLYSTEHSLSSEDSSVISETSKFSDPCRGTSKLYNNYFRQESQGCENNETMFSKGLQLFLASQSESEWLEGTESGYQFEKEEDTVVFDSLRIGASAHSDDTDRTTKDSDSPPPAKQERSRFRTLRGVVHVFEFTAPEKEILQPYWALRFHAAPQLPASDKKSSVASSYGNDIIGDHDFAKYQNDTEEDNVDSECPWCMLHNSAPTAVLPMTDINHLPFWLASQASRCEEAGVPYYSDLLLLLSASTSLVSPTAQAQTMQQALSMHRRKSLMSYSRYFGDNKMLLSSRSANQRDFHSYAGYFEHSRLLSRARKSHGLHNIYRLHRRLPQEIYEDICLMLDTQDDDDLQDVSYSFPRFSKSNNRMSFFIPVVSLILNEARGVSDVSGPSGFWSVQSPHGENTKNQFAYENQDTPVLATLPVPGKGHKNGFFTNSCKMKGNYEYEKSITLEYPPTELWKYHPLGLPLVQLVFHLLGERLDQQLMSIISAGLLSVERANGLTESSENPCYEADRKQDDDLVFEIRGLREPSCKESLLFEKIQWIHSCQLNIAISKLMELKYLKDTKELEESFKSISQVLGFTKSLQSPSKPKRSPRASPQSSLTRIYAQAFAQSSGLAEPSSSTIERPVAHLRAESTFPFSHEMSSSSSRNAVGFSTSYGPHQQHMPMGEIEEMDDEHDSPVPSLMTGNIDKVVSHAGTRGPFFGIDEELHEESPASFPSSCGATPTANTVEELNTESTEAGVAGDRSTITINDLSEAVSKMSEKLCSDEIAKGAINALSRCTPNVPDTLILQDLPADGSTEWLTWRVNQGTRKSEDEASTEAMQLNLLDESTKNLAERSCRQYAYKLKSYGIYKSSKLFDTLASKDYSNVVSSKPPMSTSTREHGSPSDFGAPSRSQTGDSASAASEFDHTMPFGFTTSRMKRVQQI